MIDLQRLTIKIAGESGQGVNSIGEMTAKAIKESGFYSFGYREYPSLIKGGYACHQIDFADHPLSSSSTHVDLLMCLSRVSFHAYLPTVRKNGQVVHMLRQLDLTEAEQTFVDQQNIKIAYLPAETLAVETGGSVIMANTIMLGALWQLIGLPLAPLDQVLKAEFAKKPDVIEPNIKCLTLGHKTTLEGLSPLKVPFKVDKKRGNDGLLTGNHLMALGGVAAGVRAYFAYPMTPSSSILTYMANIYKETGILVKQVEDEISVAQMAVGAMFMGTRALIGTSGGGFDLMTETVSMAAMTEVPFVCILAQRPGPATGLPTWTMAGDLNVAAYGAHGEFTRCVIAAGDAASAYLVVQKAFNIAEKYQIPVMVLTEKQIAEALYQLEDLPADVPIERHLVPDDQLEKLKPSDRFKLTETGISPRWLPGQSDAMFDGNGDEHTADGSITEEAGPSRDMYAKRLKKTETLLNDLPEPEIMGPADAILTFVGWGSVKSILADVMVLWNQAHPEQQINYLHYEVVYPVKTNTFQQLVAAEQPLVLIENNATGQLGALLTQMTGYLFTEKVLKYDGRPFFVEDILGYLQARMKV